MDFVVGQITEEDEVWFAPDFRDNLSKPAGAQARVKLRPFQSGKEYRILQFRTTISKADAEALSEGAEIGPWLLKLDEVNRQIVLGHVVGFENFYTVDKKTNERKEIQDVKEFVATLDTALQLDAPDLYAIIADKVRGMNTLTETDTKNSAGSSAG